MSSVAKSDISFERPLFIMEFDGPVHQGWRERWSVSGVHGVFWKKLRLLRSPDDHAIDAKDTQCRFTSTNAPPATAAPKRS